MAYTEVLNRKLLVTLYLTLRQSKHNLEEPEFLKQYRIEDKHKVAVGTILNFLNTFFQRSNIHVI